MDKKELWFQKSWFHCVVLSLLVAVLYFRIFWFELTYFDDQFWVIDYQWFFKKWSNIIFFFTRPDFISYTFYRPLLNMTFLIDGQIGHFALWPYRVTNLVIHMLATCLVYHLFNCFQRQKGQSFVLALIFAVHPVFVMAVGWIPGRTDSLLGLFVFGALLSFIYFFEKKQRRWIFGHMLCWALALLTKETAIVLPVVCGFYGILYYRREFFRKWGWWFLGWGFLGGGFLIVRTLIVKSAGQQVPLIDLLKSLLTNLPALWLYLGKTVLPFNNSVFPTIKDSSLLWGVAALFILLFSLIASKYKDWRNVFMGEVIFLLFLLPALVLSFIEHEYRLYVSLVGILLILGQTWFFQNNWSVKVKNIAATIALIGLIVINFFHQNHLKDRFAFWNNAVKAAPHAPLAHRNLAAMYFLENNFDKAQEEFRKAADLNYQEAMVHNNLALIYMHRGDFEAAEKEYQLEIKFNPTYGNVYYNFGVLKVMQKAYSEALVLWEKAIFYDPKHMDAALNLYNLYIAVGNKEKAKFWEKYLQERGVSVGKTR